MNILILGSYFLEKYLGLNKSKKIKFIYNGIYKINLFEKN